MLNNLNLFKNDHKLYLKKNLDSRNLNNHNKKCRQIRYVNQKNILY